MFKHFYYKKPADKKPKYAFSYSPNFGTAAAFLVLLFSTAFFHKKFWRFRFFSIENTFVKIFYALLGLSFCYSGLGLIGFRVKNTVWISKSGFFKADDVDKIKSFVRPHPVAKNKSAHILLHGKKPVITSWNIEPVLKLICS